MSGRPAGQSEILVGELQEVAQGLATGARMTSPTAPFAANPGEALRGDVMPTADGELEMRGEDGVPWRKGASEGTACAYLPRHRCGAVASDPVDSMRAWTPAVEPTITGEPTVALQP